MSAKDVDLERAAIDPAYRRRVMYLINEDDGGRVGTRGRELRVDDERTSTVTGPRDERAPQR